MDITAYLSRKEIFQYALLEPGEIPFSESVLAACRANRCGRYGTNWCCPPGVGEPEELERRIKGYAHAAVFSCKYQLEDCFDFEGMQEAKEKTEALLREIADGLRQEGTAVLPLGCGGCNRCAVCTYPEAPCRFPESVILSVEACGINVVSLAKNLGITYNNGPDTVTYFCILLF